MSERNYWLAVSRVTQMGPARLQLLLNYYGSAQKVWSLTETELHKTGLPKNAVEEFLKFKREKSPDDLADFLVKNEVNFVCQFEDGFPVLLKETPDAPMVLYYKGEALTNFEKTIAVVGTRRITSYGKLVTEKITSELIEMGFTIVSGLALGVDAAAHKTALEMGGQTVAVLGSGVNHVYPVSNYGLSKQILASGGAVVSEYWPDTPANTGTFPARNRIISGLSMGVVVTEGAEDSGSLITAQNAIEQNREVFAVPGPITSETSKGPALLIKQGAKLVTSAQDVVEELKLQMEPREKKDIIFEDDLEEKLYGCLKSESKFVDEIVQETNLATSAVMKTLTKMELRGLIRSAGDRSYSIK